MKILVITDDARHTAEIYELPDPTVPLDQAGDPLYAARCYTCRWDSFVSQNTVHVIQADAVDDASTHLLTSHMEVSS